MKTYLFAVAASAMAVAVLDSLFRSGTVKRAVSLVGTLLLILVLLRPLARLDADSFGEYLSGLELRRDEVVSGIAVENKEIMAGIIAEKTEAYILDKAAELGAEVEVTVSVVQGSDYPYPWSAEITGVMTEAQKAALSAAIEASLAIPKERQVYPS